MRSLQYRSLAVGVVAAALLAGCASQPKVLSDYDKSADFGKYRTFGFVSQVGADSTEFRSLAVQTMQSAATRQMELRGYTRSDTPDLVINFTGKIEEKADVESVPAPYYGPGWGYGGFYGAPYGGWGYGGGTQVTTRRYNVGTLVMDIVDREKRQAVFQASISDVITKEMTQNREAAINGAVTRLFAKYPFVAGQTAPVPVAESK
jgi:Domain of unknown function (DUF4136)